MDELKKLRCSRRGHESHLSKLFNCIDVILTKAPMEALTDSDVAMQSSRLLQESSTESNGFADIHRKIMDHLEDKDELKTRVFESEALQTICSDRKCLYCPVD